MINTLDNSNAKCNRSAVSSSSSVMVVSVFLLEVLVVLEVVQFAVVPGAL